MPSLSSSKSHQHWCPALRYHLYLLSVVWSVHYWAFASWVPGKCCGTPEREAQQSDCKSRCDGGWEKLLCCSLRRVPLRMHFHKCSCSARRVESSHPEEYSISECSLMQSKARVFDGHCSQPGGGAFLSSERMRSLLACSDDFLQILQVIFLSLPFLPRLRCFCCLSDAAEWRCCIGWSGWCLKQPWWMLLFWHFKLAKSSGTWIGYSHTTHAAGQSKDSLLFIINLSPYQCWNEWLSNGTLQRLQKICNVGNSA